MKVKTPTAALLDAVGHGAAVAAAKSPKQILESVVLRADGTTGLSIEATDLDVAIRRHISEATVEQPGTLVVPAARLLSVLREVEDEELALDVEDGALAIDSGPSHFRIRSESAEEFPAIPYFPEEGAVALPAEMLRNMIRRTVFSTAKDAGRFALHGVLFRLSGDGAEMVATDGRRLARVVGALPSPVAKDARVIIGPKGLHLLERVLDEAVTEVEFAVEERQALFRCGSTLVVSRLIDGSFPAYEDVIPQSPKRVFTSTAAELAAGLRRASLLATRDAMSVEFSIEPATLQIRSRAREVGEARIEVPIDYDGDPQKVGFNPAFLQDALKVMEPASEIRFEFTDGKAPGKLTDCPEYTYVVMPIALE